MLWRGSSTRSRPSPSAEVIDLDAPFVDLAPMNDDLLISTARCGNSHHSFHRNRTLATALEFDPHGAPPFRFMARCRGQFAAVRGSPPQLCLSTRIVARIGEEVNYKTPCDQPYTNGPSDAGGTTSQPALTRDPAHNP